MKFVVVVIPEEYFQSPSTRREWIEIIAAVSMMIVSAAVSLHTEGVD